MLRNVPCSWFYRRPIQRTFTVCVLTERPVAAPRTCFYGWSFKHISWYALELALCSVARMVHFAGCWFHWESFWVHGKWAACHSFSMEQENTTSDSVLIFDYLILKVITVSCSKIVHHLVVFWDYLEQGLKRLEPRKDLVNYFFGFNSTQPIYDFRSPTLVIIGWTHRGIRKQNTRISFEKQFSTRKDAICNGPS